MMYDRRRAPTAGRLVFDALSSFPTNYLALLNTRDKPRRVNHRSAKVVPLANKNASATETGIK